MRNSFDKFELKISLRGPCKQDDELVPQVFLITQSILINGENISPKTPVDLKQLVKSSQLSGEFFIFTCGCGHAGCAGIEEGIKVNHLVDGIVWEVPDPIVVPQLIDGISNHQTIQSKFRRYTFDPSAYLAAIENGLREAKRLLFGKKQPVEFSPYGFNPEDLIELDPRVFSERGAPLGCQIIGRKVEIEGEPGRISINGVGYDLRELPVPDSIKSLDDWSTWEPKQAGDGFVYGSAAAPAGEVRRRMKLLAEHLSSITHRGGMIIITMREDWNKGCKYQLQIKGKFYSDAGAPIRHLL